MNQEELRLVFQQDLVVLLNGLSVEKLVKLVLGKRTHKAVCYDNMVTITLPYLHKPWACQQDTLHHCIGRKQHIVIYQKDLYFPLCDVPSNLTCLRIACITSS